MTEHSLYLIRKTSILRCGLFDFTLNKHPTWMIHVAYYLLMSRGQKHKSDSEEKPTEDNA